MKNQHSHLLPALALLLGASPAALAQDEGAAPPAEAAKGDPEDELQELIDEYADARADYMERYREAESDEERMKLRSSYPDPADHAQGFLDLAERYPGTTHAAQALAWVVANVREGDARGQALQALAEHHVEDAALFEVCRSLVRGDGDADTIEILRKVLAATPHHDVRGMSAYALALQLEQKAEDASGEEAEILLGEYEELLETCVAEYGDVDYFPDYKTLAEAAEGELFELRNLQIGMVAPDIEGEDLDGVPFTLSDYRGKVVMLDFWGDW